MALPRPLYADVVLVQWKSATAVLSMYAYAIVAQGSGHSATMGLPRQPYADVAPFQ